MEAAKIDNNNNIILRSYKRTCFIKIFRYITQGNNDFVDLM